MSLNSALSLVRTWVQHALEQCVQQAKQQPDTDSSTAGELFWNLEHHNEQGNVVAFCFSGELRLHFAVRQVSIARRQDEEADERHRAATRSGTRVSPLCTLVFSVAKDVEDMEFDRPSHFWVLIFFNDFLVADQVRGAAERLPDVVLHAAAGAAAAERPGHAVGPVGGAPARPLRPDALGLRLPAARLPRRVAALPPVLRTVVASLAVRRPT